jgi:hypothetical protein
MSQEFKIPQEIKNEQLWRKRCRKIRARASDLLEGRLGIIEAARELLPLASQTKVEDEPEFRVFLEIDLATRFLPIGEVRAYWAPDALAREDIRIRAAETRWDESARSAAARLVERYQWTIRRRDSLPIDE